jgi:predicted ATPase
VLEALHVRGYRSARDVHIELAPVSVLVGENGTGKTNLYRALQLARAAAEGSLSRDLAGEGGMPSVLWAGPRKKAPVRMEVEVRVDGVVYELGCGLPSPTSGASREEGTAFVLDPEVKHERVAVTEGKREIELARREGLAAWLRDDEGVRRTYVGELDVGESMLAQLRDPHRFSVVSRLRHALAAFRFYHHFRTDAEAPLRAPRVGIRTPILDDRGHDLAAALQTIREIGDEPGLARHVDAAFPGARLRIDTGGARFEVTLEMKGIQRALRAAELSDGTMRYLCLLAALLSPRPPALLALNEPETSLHDSLLEPLAALLAEAARRSQLWITTHSMRLGERLVTLTRGELLRVQRIAGETRVEKAAS